ncbi:MAG TPA: hypothetical protein DDY12_08455 [Porphyromonadaceae bacterium]|nr:hypothetical protein [Porphyromonadaceae bacterium]
MLGLTFVMKHPLRYFTITLSLIVAVAMQATEVNVSPGLLERAVGDDRDNVTTLIVTGAVNAADLHFVCTSLPSLETLDLSGVTVEAYNGKTLVANRGDFPASTLPAYILSGLKASTVILPGSITSIGEGAMMGAAVQSLEIPAAVRSIGDNAFCGCDGLTSVTIPATVEDVGRGVFSSCRNLKTVSYGLHDIPASAFAGCTSLVSVETPSGLRSICREAFRQCVSLAGFDYGTSLVTVGDFAFSHSGLEEAVMSSCSGLSHIGKQAFGNCDRLTSVSLPDGVTTLGAGAFLDDTALESVNFPAATRTVEPYTFKGAAAVNDASRLLSGDVDSIGAFAFAGMDKVGEVVLPSRLADIGDNAFEGWLSLNTIRAEEIEGVPSLGNDVWAGVYAPGVFLYVPDDLKGEFMSAPQWKEFNITQSGTIDMTRELGGMPSTAVSVAWDGPTLTITSDSKPIETVKLYDIAGRLLHSCDNIASSTFTIDTGGFTTDFYIIHVTTPPAAVSFKTARR